ncbi:MAG: membrane protein insertion efficiency factor YidD [candidate division WOR-3 bacterium]
MTRILLILIVIVEICSAYNSINVTTNWTLIFYKKFISPLQGQHICNFSPTCSQFFRASVNKYGFLIGSIMGADRLLRCNPSAWNYLDQYYFGIHNDRIDDPPENHYLKLLKIKTPTLKNNQEILTLNLRVKKQSIFQFTDTAILKLLDELDFADYLFDNHDYLRAIGEYKRILFYLEPIDNYLDLKQYIELKIAESYLKIKEFDQAWYYFSKNQSPYFYFGQARICFEQNNYQEARNKLQFLENTELDKERIILTGWSYYKERNFMQGARFFDENKSKDTTNLLYELSKYDGSDIKHRSQTLSTLMSSIIPGLGQVYCNRFGDGMYSFITVVSSGLIANYYYHNDSSRIKFGIFAFLTTYFWLGNIYGANISARDFNEYQIRNYQNRIDDILSRFNFTQKYYDLINKIKDK